MSANEWITLVGVIVAGFAAYAAYSGVQATKAGVVAAKAGADAALAAVAATKAGADATLAGVEATKQATAIAKMVGETQKMLSQRQLLLPLWTYMTNLKRVDPANPLPGHVLDGVHALELIALCCEGGMVDERVIKRTFRDVFLNLYDQIESCGIVPSLDRDGKAILKENPAAMAFYTKLKREHMDRDKLEPV
jgi:hypothetical protein